MIPTWTIPAAGGIAVLLLWLRLRHRKAPPLPHREKPMGEHHPDRHYVLPFADEQAWAALESAIYEPEEDL